MQSSRHHLWPTTHRHELVGPPFQEALQPAIRWLWQLQPAGAESAADAGSLRVACRRTVKMARLEAVLLVADVPLAPRRLAQFATLADATEARTLINRLNAAYEQAGTPFRIERVAAGYRLFT